MSITCCLDLEIGYLSVLRVTLNKNKKIIGACIARSDGMSVIGLTYSICLVYKITIIRAFDFLQTKAIAHGRSANFDQFQVTLNCVLKIIGA